VLVYVATIVNPPSLYKGILNLPPCVRQPKSMGELVLGLPALQLSGRKL